MTAVLSSGGHFFQPPHLQLQMTENAANDAWRRQYFQQMSVPTSQWQENSGNMATMTHGMLENDLRMFQSEATSYDGSYTTNHQQNQHHQHSQLVSPRLAFPPEASWASDMEINTPSTTGFPSNIDDGYHTMRHTSSISTTHLSLPHSHHERVLSNGDSPHSSYSGLSPNSHYALPIKNERLQRPGIMRATTAPENIITQRNRLSAESQPMPSPPIKRSASDDEADEDEDYIPSSETNPKSSAAGRGRKRQRIPHTAVERRYRENLNAHLDRLRQTVPQLAALNRGPGMPKGKGDESAGPKPSKCEILNGAIEHIGALGKENHALKVECKALRARLDDLERWLAQR